MFEFFKAHRKWSLFIITFIIFLLFTSSALSALRTWLVIIALIIGLIHFILLKRGQTNPTTHQKLKHSLIAILIIMTSSTVTSLGKEIANQPDTPVQQAAKKKTTKVVGAHDHTAATSTASSTNVVSSVTSQSSTSSSSSADQTASPVATSNSSSADQTASPVATSSSSSAASSSTPDPIVPSPTETTNPASSTTPPPVADNPTISVAPTPSTATDSPTQDTNESVATNSGGIIGDVNSHIYHLPSQKQYHIKAENVIHFTTEAEAQAAGYRRSKR
ncbi:hypothetical protein KAR50_07420 [Periweissella fabaria]|uniref:Uncharacterized protein n=1 Tax=Periweissella fabaria TaxID=546157 RepID=A0ABN8BGM2_9LACO|nr:hypothetical protein [Periweissella fabaria]MCM0597671.1 hypothetical protein [Periweissella fabaria]CAH0416856.1 hypothetical protein WFA24289_01169 [Periweissella fabaria]